MSVKPEVLWIAAMLDDRVWIRTAVLRGRSFVWVTGTRRLKVPCLGSDGCSFAEARVSSQGKPPDEIKRLLFNQNNTVGEFEVRVYRTMVTATQALEDFNQQVDPATYQGQN